MLCEMRVEDSAHLLLGATLVSPIGSCLITEVEAYGGADDPGSHAYRGITPRTEPMFGPAGHAFIYFTYGNHWMLCITAHDREDAAATLIRAGKPLSGLEEMKSRRAKAKSEHDLLTGPGKLTQALGIDKQYNELDLLNPKNELYILPTKEVIKYPVIDVRVGLAEGKGEHTPWRFLHPDYIQDTSLPRPRI
ncbi:MAG: DNA-3-methyladenine glycosylase [Armatimonadetes bacterium]|nr:DNA-3-methyladenine glycosylase [Armatimonadota bacterium]